MIADHAMNTSVIVTGVEGADGGLSVSAELKNRIIVPPSQVLQSESGLSQSVSHSVDWGTEPMSDTSRSLTIREDLPCGGH